MSHFLSIDKLLRNDNASQLRLGRNPTTPVYSYIKNCVKNVKIAKQSHAYKGYVSTYNVDMLSSFNLELQLKNTKSAIKKKVKDLLTELKGFKNVTK